MFNDWYKESGIQAGKAVAGVDQEGEGKMNVIQKLGVFKKTTLLRKGFWVYEGDYWRGWPERKSQICVIHQINEAKTARYY